MPVPGPTMMIGTVPSFGRREAVRFLDVHLDARVRLDAIREECRSNSEALPPADVVAHARRP